MGYSVLADPAPVSLCLVVNVVNMLLQIPPLSAGIVTNVTSVVADLVVHTVDMLF